MKKILVTAIVTLMLLMIGVPKLKELHQLLYAPTQPQVAGLLVHQHSYNPAGVWDVELDERAKAYAILDGTNYENLTRRNDLISYFSKNYVWTGNQFLPKVGNKKEKHFLKKYSEFNLKDGRFLTGLAPKSTTPQLIHDFKTTLESEDLTTLKGQVELPIGILTKGKKLKVARSNNTKAAMSLLVVKTRNTTTLHVFYLIPGIE
jgi:hypothetical protein